MNLVRSRTRLARFRYSVTEQSSFSSSVQPLPLSGSLTLRVSLGASFRFRLKAFALQQCSALRTLTTAQRIEY